VHTPETPWLELALALAIGALVGIERERRKRDGQGGSGLRTFVLVAEAGAIAAWLSGSPETPWIFLATGAFVTVVILAGYWLEARREPEHLGKTTEIGVIVVYLLGGAVVLGRKDIAVALAIATSAILAFKEPLHGFVDRIGREELQAAIKLLIATFIVLPVLPNRTIDPFDAVNPHSLWWLVILISGLSFLGYLVTKWLGSKRGLLVTGLAGGMVSSTATTVSLSKRAGQKAGAAKESDAVAAAILAAWTIMPIRIAVVVGIVALPALRALALPLGILAVVSGGFAIVFLLRSPKSSTVGSDIELKNPFSLSASLRFALLFAVVLVVVAVVRQKLPGIGLRAVSALGGLLDVDAITLSLVRVGESAGVASAILIAALSNTLAKGAFACALGSPALRRRVAIATVAILAAGGFALATIGG
jgi:uncharacterized membrane protein (DUF4010 family)